MWSSPFIIPVVAIVGGLLTGVISMLLNHQQKMRKLDQQNQSSASSSEIAELRARIEALETLATDGKEQLRREIDRL